MKPVHSRIIAAAILLFVAGFRSGPNYTGILLIFLGFGSGWCIRSAYSHWKDDLYYRNRLR
jgi:hypothetical protein